MHIHRFRRIEHEEPKAERRRARSKSLSTLYGPVSIRYNYPMPQTLQALAEFTASRLIGDGRIQIAKVASIAHAQPGDLVFVEMDAIWNTP